MRFYRCLLLLYPAAFRAQYDAELLHVFEARRRHSSAGIVSRFAFWFETVLDALLTAFQIHCDMLWQDLRYCMRGLRRSPGFAATAVLVAALGVGATTAAFTVTDQALLRASPFPEAARLVKVWEDMSPGNYKQLEPSPANYRDWKRLNHSFSAMAAYRSTSFALTGAGDPMQVEGAAMTSDLLPLLGAQTRFGRIFSSSDDRPGAPGTLLLSFSLWQSRFGADPDILGRRLLLDGEPFVVIGVMSQHFHFPRSEVQIWTPMRFNNSDFVDRNDNYLRVVAQLRPGITRDEARADMHLVSAQLKRAYPKDN